MFIQFGYLQIKLLIPILFPVFLKVRRLIRRNYNINSAAFKGFNDFLSLTVCGILFLIQKKNTQSEKIQQKQEGAELKSLDDNSQSSKKEIIKPKQKNVIMEIEEKSLEMEKIQKKKKLYFVILISVLQIVAVIIKNIFKNKIKEGLKLNIAVLIEIILLITFSMKFLGLIIYSHQIFSAIILFICLIIFFVESVIYNDDIGIKEVIEGFIFYFFVQLFYSLSDVLGKKYLNTFTDNFYLFLFKIGIVGLIPFTLYGIIACYIDISKNDKDKNFQIFQIFLDIPVLIYLEELIFSCLFEIGLWLTIYYLTPCHYIIFEAIADFLEIILYEFDHDTKKYTKDEQKITYFILYPILIFAVLVFNEIIILNFCGLNYNTKIQIMEREKIDIFCNNINEQQLIINDEDDDDEIIYNNEGNIIIKS